VSKTRLGEKMKIKELRNIFVDSLVFTLITIAICGIIYGYYWLVKIGSYSFFYEDMVIKTIHQQVQPQYLQ